MDKNLVARTYHGYRLEEDYQTHEIIFKQPTMLNFFAFYILQGLNIHLQYHLTRYAFCELSIQKLFNITTCCSFIVEAPHGRNSTAKRFSGFTNVERKQIISNCALD